MSFPTASRSYIFVDVQRECRTHGGHFFSTPVCSIAAESHELIQTEINRCETFMLAGFRIIVL